MNSSVLIRTVRLMYNVFKILSPHENQLNFVHILWKKFTINVMSSGKYFKLFSFMFIVPSGKVKYKRFDSLKK